MNLYKRISWVACCLLMLMQGGVHARDVVLTAGSDYVPTGQFAKSVTATGDIDNDGFDDVAVGMNGRGVYVYFGHASGVSEAIGWKKVISSGNYGQDVVLANLNGDPYADLIVSAYTAETNSGVRDEGHIYVYYGSSTGLPASPDWTVKGGGWNVQFGRAVAAGDVDNDGIDDIIAAHGTSSTGSAYIFKGSVSGMFDAGGGEATIANADWTVSGIGANYLGRWAAVVGDVNKDGVNDLMFAGYGANGAAYLFFGQKHDVGTGVPRIDTWDWRFVHANSSWGHRIAGIGDVNNDTIDDFAVTHPGTTSGAVHIFYGQNLAVPNASADVVLSASGLAAYGSDGFGSSVIGLGDYNGDSIDDFAVGFGSYSPSVAYETKGGVFIYYGQDTVGPAATADSILLGKVDNARYGVAISYGLIDADAEIDLVIGARLYPYNITPTTSYTGAAIVHPSTPAPASVSIHPSPLLTGYHTTSEQGASSSYTVVLDTQPSVGETVRLNFSSNAPGEVDISPAFFEFNDGNWDQPVTITITGQDDDLDDGDIQHLISTSIVTSDVAYSSVVVDDVSVKNTDDDAVQIVVEHLPNLHTTEGGGTASFTVRLDAKPTSNVTIGYGSTMPGEGMPDPVSVTFTPTDFRTPKTVTIVGQDDAVFDGNVAYQITPDPYFAITDDLAYKWRNSPSINVINVDDDAGYNPLIIAGDRTGGGFGRAVSSAGDLNADGFDDFLVAAPTYSNGETKEGRVYVFYGAPNGYQAAVTTLELDQVYAYFGYAMTALGDVNGDGYDDVAISATGYDGGEVDEGRVFVYYGSSTGISVTADWVVELNQADARLGVSLAALDANGDGFQDLLVGADRFYAADFSSNTGIREGAAFIFYGSETGLADAGLDGVADINDAGWHGETGGSGDVSAFYGEVVAAIGDVNCDGYQDLAVGAPDYARNGQAVVYSYVFVYYGSSNGPRADGQADWLSRGDIVTDSTAAYFGSAISAAGNVNGDQYMGRACDDLLIGSETYSPTLLLTDKGEGRTYVYYGSSSGLSTAHDWAEASGQPFSMLGTAVISMGDIDGDGYDDIMSGASLYDGAYSEEGWVYAHMGSASGVSSRYFTLFPQRENTYFGGALARLGDVNGDGRDDFIVGAAGYGDPVPYSGGAYLYLSNTVDIYVWPQTGLYTSEGLTSDYFTVSLTAEPTDSVSIGLRTSNSAEGAPVQSVLNFDAANWYIPQQVEVRGVDDPSLDGDVLYTVFVDPPVTTDGRYSVIDPVDVSVINLSDEQSVVTIVASDAAASEVGPDVAVFTISRTGGTPTALPVHYALSGVATNGVDYAQMSGVIEIPAGQVSVDLVITPNADGFIEGAEVLTVTIEANARYIVGGANADVATITDGTVAGVTVNPVAGLMTSEQGGTATFTVVLDSQPSQPVTIDLLSNTHTPVEGVPHLSQLVFNSSNWNQPQAVTVIGQDDSLTDTDQLYIVQLLTTQSSDPAYNNTINPADVSVTNIDDESLPVVTVRAKSTSTVLYDKYQTTQTFTFMRAGDTSGSLTVYYEMGGRAYPGRDYTAPSGVVNFGVGVASVDVPITILADIEMEGPETLTMNVLPDTAYVQGMPVADSVVIYDLQKGLPYVSLGPDVRVADDGGSDLVFYVPLTSNMAFDQTYVTFELSGDATVNTDYRFMSFFGSSGQFALNSTAGPQMLQFTIFKDAIPEGPETIILTLTSSRSTGSSDGYARLSARNSVTITIDEGNVTPIVALTSEQSAVKTRTTVAANGNVTIRANVTDYDVDDTHNYIWSAGVADIDDADPTTFVFDPSGLNPSNPSPNFYKIGLTVTDNGVSPVPVSAEILVEVVTTAPALTGADSDGDGASDSAESYDDSDGDGIPDYLDYYKATGSYGLHAHELQVLPLFSNSYLMMTEPGLTLRLGDIAFAAGAESAGIGIDDIANYGDGEGGSGSASATDSVINIGGYVDFEVAGLNVPGDVVRVTVPLLAPLPEGAVYRKYHPVDGWRDFTVDAKNAISSAPGGAGQCPMPRDVAYTPGLTAGHYCMQLMIEDGGANDDDGAANGVVKDPGQIGKLPKDDVGAPVASVASGGGSKNDVANEGGGGGGSVHFLLLLLTAVWLLRRRYVRLL